MKVSMAYFLTKDVPGYGSLRKELNITANAFPCHGEGKEAKIIR